MKKGKLLLVLGLSLVLLGACGSKKSESSTNEVTKDPFKVGVLPAESAIPIIIAKEKGFFDKEGIDVAVKSFSSPNDRNVAVQSKEIDGTIGDVMTVATFKDHGVNMKITSDISEDFKIISAPNSGITTIKQLDKKSVTLVPNFILEYIMDTVAKRNKITYKVVDIPNFSARTEAVMASKVDAAVYTEPQTSMMVKQGAHLLASSKEEGIKGGTLSFTDEMIKNHPGNIKAFYRAYDKAVTYMNNHDSSSYAKILKKYQFPDQMAAYLEKGKGSFEPAGRIKEDQFKDIIKWAENKKQIKKSYTADQLSDYSFLK